MIDAALLFCARCESERLLPSVREELGVGRVEFVDSTTRWSRCRDGSGEWVTVASGLGGGSWPLASGLGRGWWPPPRQSLHHQSLPERPAAAVTHWAAAGCRRWQN